MSNESPDKLLSPPTLPYVPRYQVVDGPIVESPTQSLASSSTSPNKLLLGNAGGSPLVGLMSSMSLGKSRRTRPKSIYSDLDGYINNSTPSLVIDNKGSPKKINDEDYPDLLPPSSPRFGPPGSPTRKSILSRRSSPTRRRDSQTSNYNGGASPFNFTSISMSNNTTNILQKASHRKGHRYKHSSVSMNFFQEPKKKSSQLSIPSSLPIPNFSEFIDSLKADQKFKLSSCAIHLVYASIVFVFGFRYSLPCLTTLAHLVFFDSINNLLAIIVQVFKNFEVWDKASIKRPFGLSRLEVLFGFALSVALFYVGFDLITHCIEEFVISLIDLDFNHENHSEHNESSKEMSSFLFTSLVLTGLVITLINSKLLSYSSNQSFDTDSPDMIKKNLSNLGLLDDDEDEEAKMKQTSFLRSAFIKMIIGIRVIITKNTIVTNPIKLLTVMFITYLLIFYQYFNNIIISFNEIQTFVIAILILYFAFIIMKKLFKIILLAFPYNSKSYNRISTDIENKILQTEGFKSHYRFDRILITKVNYSLFIVLVKLNMMGGSDQDEYNVRVALRKIIETSIIKAEQDNGVLNFEITIDVDRM